MAGRCIGALVVFAALACVTEVPVRDPAPARGAAVDAPVAVDAVAEAAASASGFVVPTVPTAEGQLTCGDVDQRVRAARDRALLENNACATHDDCVHVGLGIGCWGNCGTYVHRDRQAQFGAAIADISQRFCQWYPDYCGYVTPACAVSVPGCIEGRCTSRGAAN